MAFYESISDVYDLIFPLNPAQLDFIRQGVGNIGRSHILDVGCGTGSLSLALAGICKDVTGIDPDGKMLELAREKAGGRHSNLQYLQLGMLDIGTHFDHLDCIICFGNTLVHLSSQDEIFSFVSQSKKALTPGGRLMIQIINYDRVIDKGIKSLPTIENDQICFERLYHYDAIHGSIDFETRLTIKSQDRMIYNSITLTPVRKTQLHKMLTEAGFHDISYYGDFKRGLLEPDSTPLVVEAS